MAEIVTEIDELEFKSDQSRNIYVIRRIIKTSVDRFFVFVSTPCERWKKVATIAAHCPRFEFEYAKRI
jgi:hypothetical protein